MSLICRNREASGRAEEDALRVVLEGGRSYRQLLDTPTLPPPRRRVGPDGRGCVLIRLVEVSALSGVPYARGLLPKRGRAPAERNALAGLRPVEAYLTDVVGLVEHLAEQRR